MRRKFLMVFCLIAAMTTAGCTSGSSGGTQPNAAGSDASEQTEAEQTEEENGTEETAEENAAETSPAGGAEGPEMAKYESDNGWYVEYDPAIFAVSASDDQEADADPIEEAIFTYIGDEAGTDQVLVLYYPEMMPEEALYEATAGEDGLPDHERSEGYFAGRTDVWSLRMHIDETGETGEEGPVIDCIGVEHNGGTLLLKIITQPQKSEDTAAALSNALTSLLDSFTFTEHEPQTGYAYVPGKYEQEYEEEMNGTMVTVVYYVQLNEDHTGVVSFQDDVQIIWYCREGKILDAKTGEQIYEYAVEGDMLYLMDGEYQFEFIRK